MSNYRDDINDVAVASDSTWGGFHLMAEGTLRVGAALLVGVIALHADGVVVADEVIDQARLLHVERASISDEALGTLHAAEVVVDSRRIADQVVHRVAVLHAETVGAGDELAVGRRERVTEAMAAGDKVFGVLRAVGHVADGAHASDAILTRFVERLEDTAAVGEAAIGRLRAGEAVSEAAVLADELLSAGAVSQAIADAALARDETWGLLRARNVVSEMALVEDHMPGAVAVGQAWTANTETWAMSRYSPFAATSAAVIDGVLYVTTADGVYALDGGDETIEARLLTGKIDVGQGRLVRPLYAYMEYELQGTATIQVSQTQGGSAAQAYSYPLAAEPADMLTNGRFLFGRGLRGRHFTFELTLTGRRAYINDLSVLAAPTQRRI